MVRGLGASGLPVNVPVQVVDGQIAITQALLDNFVNDSRLTIIVQSPNAGPVNLFVQAQVTQQVDLDAPLQAVAGPTTVPGSGFLVLSSPGRLEYAVHREVDGCPIRAVVHEDADQGDFRGR